MRLPKGLSIRDDSGHNLLVGKLYQTEIIHYQQNWLTLRHGGWPTNHTKKCINLILDRYELGISLSQYQGKWYVTNQDNKCVPFVDGMRISI